MSKENPVEDIDFPAWATFFTLIGFIVLCALGTWQVKRLTWKNDMIQTLEEEYNRDVTGIFLNAGTLEAMGADIKRGQIRGHFLPEKQILLKPRTYNGKPGSHVITPFHLQDDGHVILVNRGWIPVDYDLEKVAISDDTLDLSVQGGLVLTGLTKSLSGPNYFTPENNPEKDEWYTIDVEQLSKAKNIVNMLPVVFYLEKDQEKGELPRTDVLKFQPVNNHFQYSVFWYLMAFTLVVVYAARFFGPAQRKTPHHHD